MIDENVINNANLSSPGVVGDLDVIFRADDESRDLLIEDVFVKYSKYSDVGYILIGLWCFHFLDLPQRQRGREQLYGYEYIERDKVRIISDGLLSVIRYSHIEMPEDLDAIDYAYKSCIKLYHLLGGKAEDELVSQVIFRPTVSLIDSLGVLVGHEVKGSISKNTFILLKNIAASGNEPFAGAANRVLTEDIDRMNAVNNFL